MKRFALSLMLWLSMISIGYTQVISGGGSSSSGIGDGDNGAFTCTSGVCTIDAAALPNGMTATTQTAATKNTTIATTAYVDTPTTQAITTADSGADSDKAAMAIQPTADVGIVHVSLTCSDDDGCTVSSIGEVGNTAGQVVVLKNIGTYHIDFATSANNLNLAQGTPYAMAAGESLTIGYRSSQWDEIARATATIGPFTTFTLPQSDDPDTTATGMVSFDTDGWMRVYSTSQKALARIQEEIHVTVVKPQDLADAVRDAFLVWSNESGMTFTVTGWKCWSGTDDTTLNIETTLADGQTNITVDAVECATNGTGVFTGADTTITAATIANGSLIWLDFDDTDDPTYVKMVIHGYYGADVN